MVLIIANGSAKPEFRILASIALLGLAVFSFYLYNRKTVVTLTENELFIQKRALGKWKSKVYDISKIKDLKHEEMVKSDSYTSAGRVRVLGMDKTPESWKKYYNHPEVITFTFKNSTIEVGKYSQHF